MGILATILVGGIGTAIGHYFQKQSWEHQEQVRKKEAELDAAGKAFQDLSSNMDKFLYRMFQVWISISQKLPHGEVTERWNSYLDVRSQWYSTLNLKSSMIKRYFGEDINYFFESKIQTKFKKKQDELDEQYNQYIRNTKSQDKERPERGKPVTDMYDEFAKELNQSIFEFNQFMIYLIQKGDVGIDNEKVKKTVTLS